MDKTKLRKKADRLWFQLLIKPRCEVCGAPTLQVHHFYFKSHYGHLRYNTQNGISLCKKCHFILHHQDPKKIEDKITKVRGQRWRNKLAKQAQQNPKSYETITYYKAIIKHLENELSKKANSEL